MQRRKNIFILIATGVKNPGHFQRSGTLSALHFDHIADMNGITPRKQTTEHTARIIGIGSPVAANLPPCPHPPDTSNNLLPRVQVYCVVKPRTGKADGRMLPLVRYGNIEEGGIVNNIICPKNRLNFIELILV